MERKSRALKEGYGLVYITLLYIYTILFFFSIIYETLNGLRFYTIAIPMGHGQFITKT